MEKRKISVLSIVLYVLAGLLAIFTIWSIFYVQAYLAKQNVSFSGYAYEIINYYMSNAGQYGIYAVILATLGWILQKNSPIAKKAAPELGGQTVIDPTGMFADEAAELAQTEENNVNQAEAMDQQGK